MTYVVVGVDGTMHTRKHQPTWPTLQVEVRQLQLARVKLRHLSLDRAGMCVYTAAHNELDTWPRNPVGAAVAATFGAEQYPYAGNLVFVGWTVVAPDLVYNLPQAMRTAVAEVHAAVTLALAGAETAFGPVWAQAIRDYARRVVEVAGPEWLDLPPVDLFGRDVTGRSWWLCPAGGCDHAEMFHKDGRCWFNTCECGKGEL